MYLLRRQIVADKLRLTLLQSYRLLPATRGALVSSDSVVELLNRSRRFAAPTEGIPHDMATEEELAAAVADLIAVTPQEIRTWCHRAKKAPPHFRLTTKTYRYSISAFRSWLIDGCKRRIA